MRKTLFILSIFTIALSVSVQQKRLKTRVYYPGLILAADEKHQVVSGYFETYKDYDQTTVKPPCWSYAEAANIVYKGWLKVEFIKGEDLNTIVWCYPINTALRHQLIKTIIQVI